MTLALAIVGTVILLGGVFFCVVGGIGLIRLPDFYSRCHAAGMTDSAGAAGVLVGLCFFAEPLVIAKLLTVVAFIWLSSVVSTHALVKAAYARGIRLENPRVRDWTTRPSKSGEAEVVVPTAAEAPSLDELALGVEREVDAAEAPDLAAEHELTAVTEQEEREAAIPELDLSAQPEPEPVAETDDDDEEVRS